MASAADSSSEISCGFCLQTLEVIEDPRTLPCTHICCMECLEADFRKLNTTECPVCKATHELPVTEYSKYASVPDADARKKEKSDDDEKGKIHQAEPCQHHTDKAVTIACTECSELFCDSCNLQGDCWASGGSTYGSSILPTVGRKHKHQSIASIIQIVAKHTDALCAKVTETSSKEKDLLKALSEHEALVDEEISKVERRRNDEVRKLEEFKERCNHMVDLALVQSAKEEKNEVWISVQQVLSRESDGEVVKRHKELTRQVTGATDSLNSPIDVILPPVPLQGAETTKLKEEAESLSTQSYETLPSWQDFPPLIGRETIMIYSGDIYAATFYDGDLYWATSEEIFSSSRKACPKNSHTIQSLKFYKNCFVVLDIASDREAYVTILHIGSRRRKIEDKSEIFSFRRRDKSHAHLDISEDYHYVVTVDPKKKNLVYYDMQTKNFSTSYMNMKRPLGVHILLDYDVLVSDNHGHSVSKLSLDVFEGCLDNSWTNVIWTCDGIVHPTGICSDSITGLIYVGSYTEKCVYIISPKGELVYTFDTGDFTHITDVAISEDKLAICSKTMGLRTYAINREFCIAPRQYNVM